MTQASSLTVGPVIFNTLYIVIKKVIATKFKNMLNNQLEVVSEETNPKPRLSFEEEGSEESSESEMIEEKSQ